MSTVMRTFCCRRSAAVLLQSSCRRIEFPRRTFTVLTKSPRIRFRSDVIRHRFTHGKGETRNDVSLVMVRWTKLIWNKMFGKYLFVTNVLGSGLLMVVGDVIAQEYEYRHGLRQQDRYDGDRMFRMFVAGALQGPLHHYVYNWMDRVMPHRTFRNIVNKILIDQLFMSPACILIFFYTICYMERRTLEQTHHELISKFPYIYLMDWLLWPAAQYVNFRYLETKYRVAFVNVCTALYNVLMSYMKHDFGIDEMFDSSLSISGTNPKETQRSTLAVAENETNVGIATKSKSET
ncbi:mpv17-like protein 2 [Drosophila sulfurigaster albostrigata]|uniref:mpv17-like protein 2 n=1 Tax=Drosophila sulfurigaster albostrigata TaxID=89887 RepID=UPI002D21ACA0|nr:mpv17-like protein 2 [Drosophila sulfurigaster albostrigata]